MRIIAIWLCISALLLARNEYDDQAWGIGVVGQVDSIPYADSLVDDDSVSNFVPLFYYEDEYFYLHGTTYGIKLVDGDSWQLSIMSRIRFLSIPEEYQNKVQGDSLDYGARLRYFQQDNIYVDLELLKNSHDGNLANLRYSTDIVYGDTYISPYALLTYKDSALNSSYYGRNTEEIDSDLGATLGVDIKYHIYQNFYLLGGLSGTYVGNSTARSQMIDEDFTYAIYAGVGLLNDKNKPFVEVEGMKPYIRLAHGWATESSLQAIIEGATVEDKYNNQLTSIFYGHPIANSLFNIPIQVYLSPGLTYHHKSDVQKATFEADLAFKVYYTLPIDMVGIRFGIGEGFSYIDSITYIEQTEAEEKGYTSSHLNFYVDISADLNLGFIGKSFEDLWIGGAVHHRSSVFEQSSLFGRIKGGSNYNTAYLQWHF